VEGTVAVLLYAQSREAVGHRRLTLAVPAEGRPLKELLAQLARQHPPLARLLPTCRFAVNGRYVERSSTKLSGGDELAIHPPYSGG
jgi:molybdopterin converting factor subunit 1